ncbi:hypothetical protein PhiH1_215 [Halobacterium phage phiH]|uniref:Uncharacterized protein n=1 Tax=Halobacterium phage phiH TaxID=169684 RepID=A0A3G1ZKT0_BPPHH|nr:hypothetical protein JR051_gp44 [Halobacterium phage phiH]AYM00289.1 hypothetical protein PhiH1_215 [Halobacterium phage phiH]
MTHLTEAIVDEIYHEDGPEYIQFIADGPKGRDTFKKPIDRAELKRLERLTDSIEEQAAYDIHRVPVRYDDGSWEIAWDELES